jgi:hypothetical protein
MGRVNIRPPEGYFDWSEEQQLEWIRQLQAEVLAQFAESPEGYVDPAHRR